MAPYSYTDDICRFGLLTSKHNHDTSNQSGTHRLTTSESPNPSHTICHRTVGLRDPNHFHQVFQIHSPTDFFSTLACGSSRGGGKKTNSTHRPETMISYFSGYRQTLVQTRRIQPNWNTSPDLTSKLPIPTTHFSTKLKKCGTEIIFSD